MSSYSENLEKEVIKFSEADDWNSAVYEWSIVECLEIADNKLEKCICGKENLKYLFSIKNSRNGNVLFPIGSSCIKKFKRNELSDLTNIFKKLFKIKGDISKNIYIEFSTKYFSRKLLQYLYINDVFVPNKYNNYNPKNDYEFLVDMFNKSTKNTTKQEKKKINALIINYIKPHLEKTLKKY